MVAACLRNELLLPPGPDIHPTIHTACSHDMPWVLASVNAPPAEASSRVSPKRGWKRRMEGPGAKGRLDSMRGVMRTSNTCAGRQAGMRGGAGRVGGRALVSDANSRQSLPLRLAK